MRVPHVGQIGQQLGGLGQANRLAADDDVLIAQRHIVGGDLGDLFVDIVAADEHPAAGGDVAADVGAACGMDVTAVLAG